MNTARTTAWAACGTRNPATTATIMNPLVIDLDATEVTSHSDKEHARPTWKKHFGFHPLAAIIDHGQGLTGEPVSVLLRPGNAGSNTAADHITVMNQTMAALPGHTDGAPWGRRLLVRTDAAGGTKKFINHLDQQGLAYSVGLATSWLIADIASTMTEVTKQGVIRPEGTISNIDDAYVADISTKVRTLGPSATGINIEDYPPDMRFIIRVEHAARGAQLRTVDVDGRRIQMFVTNRKGHGDTPAYNLPDEPGLGSFGGVGDEPDQLGPDDHRCHTPGRIYAPTAVVGVGTKNPTRPNTLNRRCRGPSRPTLEYPLRRGCHPPRAIGARSLTTEIYRLILTLGTLLVAPLFITAQSTVPTTSRIWNLVSPAPVPAGISSTLQPVTPESSSRNEFT